MSLAPPRVPVLEMTGQPSVSIVHDYITQRGGAERVVLSMLSAFPNAEVRTSLYDEASTYPEFRATKIKVSPLNHSELLRRRHRLALPFLAPTFSGTTVASEVSICSSSGWAHGVRALGRKIVYCYTPARWLYQGATYLGNDAKVLPRAALKVLAPGLRRWDRRAAASADRYLTTSSEVRRRIQELYRRDAEVLAPPPVMSLSSPTQAVDRVSPGFWLCVSRLLPYKHVDAVVAAFEQLPHERLIVVGTGPDEAALRASAGANVRMVGRVSDPELCWLYSNCQGLVAASHEDFGLTPLEASVFGKPSVALSWGGFLDTVVQELNGLFFASPEPQQIAWAVRSASRISWSERKIQEHASGFDQGRFTRRLQEIVGEEMALAARG